MFHAIECDNGNPCRSGLIAESLDTSHGRSGSSRRGLQDEREGRESQRGFRAVCINGHNLNKVLGGFGSKRLAFVIVVYLHSSATCVTGFSRYCDHLMSHEWLSFQTSLGHICRLSSTYYNLEDRQRRRRSSRDAECIDVPWLRHRTRSLNMMSLLAIVRLETERQEGYSL